MTTLNYMLIKISAGQPIPIYKQIISQIKGLVEQGALEPGQALPSTRSLAEQLGVNRSTVYLAYAELQALGYLRSRPGSYNFVEKRRKETPYSPGRKSFISWADLCSRQALAAHKAFTGYFPERKPYLKN